MAVYRSVYPKFWRDSKVHDYFTPEDKYFMLWCLTNDYTNLVGCYEVSIKQIKDDLGYSEETVENLLYRFSKIHHVIDYDKQTKELFIRNWYKYNWTSSEKLEKPLIAAIKKIKNNNFREELIDIYNSREKVKIPYPYGMHTTESVSVSDSNTDTNSNTESIKEIIDYLNDKANKNFRYSNKETIKHINARIAEGYSTSDFKKVIDIKCSEWLNTNMDQYLRPNTLFSPSNFENYLNTKAATIKVVEQKKGQNINITKFDV